MTHSDPGRCPDCGAAGVRITYGLPTLESHEAGERGEIASCRMCDLRRLTGVELQRVWCILGTW